MSFFDFIGKTIQPGADVHNDFSLNSCYFEASNFWKDQDYMHELGIDLDSNNEEELEYQEFKIF